MFDQICNNEHSEPLAANDRDVLTVRQEPGANPDREASRSVTRSPSSGSDRFGGRRWPEKDATIVLIGVRGVGKSTLGVLAATAYGRRLIETDRTFIDETGATIQAYRKSHAPVDFHRKHNAIFRRVLEAHSTGCIIICSVTDLEAEGADILRDFSQTHPVIHVTRDPEGIKDHLQVWSADKIEQLLCATGPLLRSVTNAESYNLTERLASFDDPETQGIERTTNHFLTLKRVERDFLTLTEHLIGYRGKVTYRFSYPLSGIPVHERDFTLACRVNLQDLLDGTSDLDELQIGADVVELVIDTEDISSTALPEALLSAVARGFAILRRAIIVPIILSVGAGRRGSADENAYTALVRYCLRLGAEYCTLDLSTSVSRLESLIRNQGRTFIIGSVAFAEPARDGWSDASVSAACERGLSLGCDIVKVTMPARTISDAFPARVIATERTPSRLITYHTGAAGRTSMVFNKIMTPVRAACDERRRGDDDCLGTPKQALSALFATFVYEPLSFFIYGADVEHSLSPAMHTAAYHALGMPHTYGKHSSSTLDELLRRSRETDFGGASLVRPWKTGILPVLTGLSSHAKVIRSVNTVLPVRDLDIDGSIPSENELIQQRNRQGPVKALYGENTDWIGQRACLLKGLSPANAVRPSTTALVCGAGGQARSSIYALLSIGVRNIFVCNRTVENAEALAAYYNELIEQGGISVLDSSDTATAQIRVIESFSSPWPKQYRLPSLIISCIPPDNDDGTPTDFTLPSLWLGNATGGVVIELGYGPELTAFEKQFLSPAQKSWIYVPGVEILPELANATFELFTGRRAPRKVMRDEVMKRYRQAPP